MPTSLVTFAWHPDGSAERLYEPRLHSKPLTTRRAGVALTGPGLLCLESFRTSQSNFLGSDAWIAWTLLVTVFGTAGSLIVFHGRSWTGPVTLFRGLTCAVESLF
jgi:hypothetical protein